MAQRSPIKRSLLVLTGAAILFGCTPKGKESSPKDEADVSAGPLAAKSSSVGAPTPAVQLLLE